MDVFISFNAGYVCTFLTLLATSSAASDTFVCKKADDILSGGNVKSADTVATEERIKALEQQVERLRRAVESRPGSDTPPGVIKIGGDAFPKDCVDILHGGQTADGVYTVSPDGRCPFDVYCDMSNGGWTVIQRRRDGSGSFRQNWRKYVDGFGDLDGEFWLGLEKIHRLTAGGSRVYIGLESYDGEVDYAHYESFVVHGVTYGYRMNVDPYGYNGTIPELLSYHDNLKFSTYDRDNDQHSDNCCERYGGGGGWWYNGCYRVGLLNAVYKKRAEGGIGYWSSGSVYVLNTVMKIKPRKGMC